MPTSPWRLFSSMMLVLAGCGPRPTQLDSDSSEVLSSGPPRFAAGVGHRLSFGSPWSVASADVDTDGALDLITVVPTDGKIVVRKNQGNGRFEEEGSRFDAGAQPFAITTGDFNDDGAVDIAVANLEGHSLSVLLGRGDGTFGARIAVDTAAPPQDIAAGDFNRDGKLDLATVTQDGQGASALAVFLGKGDGSFEPAKITPVDMFAVSIAVGDFNDDGKLDVAAGGATDIDLLLGHGDGTFAESAKITFGDEWSVVRVKLGDMNHDGKLDLVAAADGRTAGMVAVYLGQGTGKFNSAGFNFAQRFIAGLELADINRDGHLDAVTSNGQRGIRPGSITIFLGRGDGNLDNPITSTARSPNGGIAIGDYNRDGILDAALTADRLNVLDGRGDGRFDAPLLYGIFASTPSAIASADFDLDGHPDLVTANYSSANVTILLGGAFGSPSNIGVEKNPSDIGAADFNGDKKPDIIVANSDSTVSVYLGRGDGTFEAPIRSAAGAFLTEVTAADLDGDGVLDIVTDDNPGSATGIAIAFGRGDGSFGAPVIHTFNTTFISDLALGDLNGDHRVDIAAVSASGNAVAVFLNQGSGRFGAPAIYPTGINPFVGAIGDMNGDGHPDIVTAGDKVSILFGKGNGTFGTPSITTIPSSIGPFGIALEDFNHDGRLDVALAGSAVAVLAGVGGGKLGSAEIFAVPHGASAQGLVSGDFNGDGKPDLATPDIAFLGFGGEIDEVAVFTNTTP